MTELMKASNQWASRPDDQRYLSLDALQAAVDARRRDAWTTGATMRDMRVIAGDGASLTLDVLDRTSGENRQLAPSNWSFGQLCTQAGAPAKYLRTLPGQLAGINLQWGFEHAGRQDQLILADQHDLRAVTSQTYGRIWDSQVVQAVTSATAEGAWQVPAASYSGSDPLRATTLYASDRDVFIFLVDEENRVDVGNESLGRGFFAWNSEVGSASFGLTTFLYRFVCDNRIVWGASNVTERRIRHTGGAPQRFAYEGREFLQRYAAEDITPIARGIEAAQSKEIGSNAKDVTQWLRDRGFTQTLAQSAVAKAEEEEGGAGSLWNVVQGLTAAARSIDHTDARVAVERKAGALMKYAD